MARHVLTALMNGFRAVIFTLTAKCLLNSFLQMLSSYTHWHTANVAFLDGNPSVQRHPCRCAHWYKL